MFDANILPILVAWSNCFITNFEKYIHVLDYVVVFKKGKSKEG